MKSKKLLICMITLILIFNLIVEPMKANAVGAVGSIASIVGKEKAAELIVFLLASAVVGVDFLEESWSDEDNLNKISNLNNLIKVDFPQWQPPNNGWKETLRDLILYGSSSIFLGDIIGWIKDWFQEKGAVEGENSYDISLPSYLVNGFHVTDRFHYYMSDPAGTSDGISRKNIDIYLTINGHEIFLIHGLTIGDVGFLNEYRTSSISRSDNRIGYTCIYTNFLGDMYNVSSYKIRDLSSIPVDYLPVEEFVNYNVKPDSIILSDRNPFEIPEWYQPKIPLIVETQEELLPDGTNQIKYDGDIDQLVDELIENISLDDIRDLEQRSPYELVETDGQTVIRFGEESEPYPEPEPGTYTGLIQSIINWLDKILKAIKELPERIADKVKTALEDLFVPSPDYLQTKIGSINTSIHDKIGLSDDIPIANYFDGLTCLPIPDGYYREHKIFDASYINNLAVTIQSWQRWFWYVLFALMNINNIYKLIRGTDLIHIGQYQGGGSGGDIDIRGGK